MFGNPKPIAFKRPTPTVASMFTSHEDIRNAAPSLIAFRPYARPWKSPNSVGYILLLRRAPPRFARTSHLPSHTRDRPAPSGLRFFFRAVIRTYAIRQTPPLPSPDRLRGDSFEFLISALSRPISFLLAYRLRGRSSYPKIFPLRSHLLITPTPSTSGAPPPF